MTNEELREKISEAGMKHDGHVTNGSLAEVLKVVLAEMESRNQYKVEYHIPYAVDGTYQIPDHVGDTIIIKSITKNI